jgi:hypothetical protein
MIAWYFEVSISLRAFIYELDKFSILNTFLDVVIAFDISEWYGNPSIIFNPPMQEQKIMAVVIFLF